MPTFHPLRVAAIDDLTDDAVALTFDVPEHLADDYLFTARAAPVDPRADDEKRRSFSIFTAPSTRLTAGRRQEAARRRRSARACSAASGSATSST